MAAFEYDDVSLNYELFGDPKGVPVLTLAPGGMHSSYGAWSRMPWNPLEKLGDYRVIAMDQRNAGQSTAPVSGTDGWHSYAADQLALMDHLGIEKFHVVGMCIGGSFIMELMKQVPERLLSAVMLQPIGLQQNREAYVALFEKWAEGLKAKHPGVSEQDWQSFCHNIFGGDFVFNASAEDAAQCHTPTLLLMGNDLYHPERISRQLSASLKNVQLVEVWKEGENLQAADILIRGFLKQFGQ